MLPLRPLDDTAAAASDTTTIDPLSLLEGSKGETDTVAGMNGFVQLLDKPLRSSHRIRLSLPYIIAPTIPRDASSSSSMIHQTVPPS
ncbi:hypothetical protein B0A49_13847, partial [Cryomyces minteri]